MIFSYSISISEIGNTGDFAIFRRPEIPITVHGPDGTGQYLGLVDTGSDNTILPRSIAEDLGIKLKATDDAPAQVFGGYRVELLSGQVRLALASDNDRIEWLADVRFFDAPTEDDEVLILGHVGFLEYFSAFFDGQKSQLELTPNSDLPRVSQQ